VWRKSCCHILSRVPLVNLLLSHILSHVCVCVGAFSSSLQSSTWFLTSLAKQLFSTLRYYFCCVIRIQNANDQHESIFCQVTLFLAWLNRLLHLLFSYLPLNVKNKLFKRICTCLLSVYTTSILAKLCKIHMNDVPCNLVWNLQVYISQSDMYVYLKQSMWLDYIHNGV